MRVGDDPVGRVTSGGYGYTVDASIAYAYLPAEHGVGTEVAVEIFGEWVAGVVAAEPLYDPAGDDPGMSEALGRPKQQSVTRTSGRGVKAGE